jgi:hypothetical protein
MMGNNPFNLCNLDFHKHFIWALLIARSSPASVASSGPNYYALISFVFWELVPN